MANVTRTRETETLLVLVRKEIVNKEGLVFNTKYEGTPAAGAVKVPVRDGEVVVAQYDKVTGAPLTQSTTTHKTILIDKDNVVNEMIDGYEAQAVPASLVAQRVDSGAYSFAITKDAYINGMIAKDGTATTLTATTAFKQILELRTKMKKANANTNGAFVKVTSDIYAELLTDPNFIKSGDLSQDMVREGVVGMVAGLYVIEDNNMGQKNSKDIKMVASHADYISYIEEFTVPVAVRDLADGKHVGASVLSGRAVYGGAILRPECVLVVTAA